MFKIVCVLLYLSTFTDKINAKNINTVCGVMNWDPENINGVATKNQYYPWSVAIHQKMDGKSTFICFGNLVNEKTVLAAAHCVSDSRTGVVKSAENYAIAVGKELLEEKKNGETINIKKIHLPKQYRGLTTNYQADITVLELEKAVPITAFVRPICLDLDNKIKFEPGQKGYLQGLVKEDFTESRNIIRDNIEVQHLSYDECDEKVPDSYKQFLTLDKICGAYVKENAVKPCHLLSGVGIAVKDESTGLYFLKGIGSNAPLASNGQSCFSSIASYTNINTHSNFLKSVGL